MTEHEGQPPRTMLQRHLFDVHKNLAAGNLTEDEALDQHWHEHFGPGGLRNHGHDDPELEPRRPSPAVWSWPTEPDITVTRLKCHCHPGKRWGVIYTSPSRVWAEVGAKLSLTSDAGLRAFLGLLSEHGKLIDATFDEE